MEKAPGLKQSFSSYQLKVTRQLNADLNWDYQEAKLGGPEGDFVSADKKTANIFTKTELAITPPNLSAKVNFSEPGGNNVLDAEETATIQIEITNSGRGNAYIVEAGLELVNALGINYPITTYFGEIKPGASILKTVELIAGQSLRDATTEMKVTISEQNGFPPDNIVLRFNTKALLPPDLCISDIRGIPPFFSLLLKLVYCNSKMHV